MKRCTSVTKRPLGIQRSSLNERSSTPLFLQPTNWRRIRWVHLAVTASLLVPLSVYFSIPLAAWVLLANGIALKIMSDTLRTGDLHINAAHFLLSEMGPRFWQLWLFNAGMLFVFANGPLAFAIILAALGQ